MTHEDHPADAENANAPATRQPTDPSVDLPVDSGNAKASPARQPADPSVDLRSGTTETRAARRPAAPGPGLLTDSGTTETRRPDPGPALPDEPTTLTKGLPVWVVRTTVAVAVVAIGALLAVQGVSGVLLVILGLLGTLCVLVPASPAPAMVIITTALSVAIAVPAPLSVGVLVLLPLVHVVHIGSAVAAVIPGTARVHLAALRPAMIRFVAVQLGTFALAGIAALVPNATTPTVFEVVGLLGAAVLALIAARLIMKRPL
ncbi:hypothetical protein GCM10029964_006960 [Kibdelosporangium lantanae]